MQETKTLEKGIHSSVVLSFSLRPFSETIPFSLLVLEWMEFVNRNARHRRSLGW